MLFRSSSSSAAAAAADSVPFRIVGFSGGNAPNAIPRDSTAEIWLPKTLVSAYVSERASERRCLNTQSNRG